MTNSSCQAVQMLLYFAAHHCHVVVVTDPRTQTAAVCPCIAVISKLHTTFIMWVRRVSDLRTKKKTTSRMFQGLTAHMTVQSNSPAMRRTCSCNDDCEPHTERTSTSTLHNNGLDHNHSNQLQTDGCNCIDPFIHRQGLTGSGDGSTWRCS